MMLQHRGPLSIGAGRVFATSDEESQANIDRDGNKIGELDVFIINHNYEKSIMDT